MTKSRTSTPTPNRVVGIDPGFDRIGVAILEGGRGAQTLLHSECIVTNKKDSHDKRLLQLGSRLQEVIAEWTPSHLAIEKLFFNQNTSTALKVAEARGVILFQAAQAGLEVFEYSPQDVKIAVTGYGQADKTSVENMVYKLVKIDGGKKKFDDEIDAVAAGLTHLATHKKP